MTSPIFTLDVSFFIFREFASIITVVYFLNYDIIGMEAIFVNYFLYGTKNDT